jgi:hypothetical protein
MKQGIIRLVFILFLFVTFIAGAYVYMFVDVKKQIENMENPEEAVTAATEDSDEKTSPSATPTESSCYDMLLKRGSLLYLINTKAPEKVGVNPILFNNLDEYITYLEKQDEKCPVLYLQEEYNTQGQREFRVRPDPFDPQGGLPLTSNIRKQIPRGVIEVADASRDNEPYNKDQYHGFDPYGLYVGRYTEVDVLHDATSKQEISENPADTNWGGVLYTQQAIDSGRYDGNMVLPAAYPTPRGGQFIPLENPHIPRYTNNFLPPTIPP